MAGVDDSAAHFLVDAADKEDDLLENPIVSQQFP
jgi:hypothetical protein